MSPRKRRREQAFPEEELDTTPALNEEELEKQRAEKEQEVWDAIREAHYEAIEQLPLTLHRQLSLMRQLDDQNHACTISLLPALQKYIKLRRAMAGISEDSTQAATNGGLVPTAGPSQDLSSPSTQVLQPNDGLTTPKKKSPTSVNSKNPLRNLTPSSVPENERVVPKAQKEPETTRQLITHVAAMAEELLRASQEKVNLAQANHESVERHIRLLDQAIKEQEATLSGDALRTSNGIVVHLPEVVVPIYPRSGAREVTDDIPDDEYNFFPEGVDEYGNASLLVKSNKSGQREEQRKDSTSLTITLPATHQSEELYCYCNRVSFGEMIACDSQSCEREWFHLGCVGLTEIPEGEWYCEDCKIDDEL